MKKIAINPNRLKWCCQTLDIDVSGLHTDVGIAEKTLENAMQSQAVLSMKQLEKLADYFNQSLLFFLEPSDVSEDKIYSPQFRTINNQKPIHSRKLRAFIKNVERQRQVYLSLLSDLNMPIVQDWQTHLTIDTARQWLGLKPKNTFNDLREAVESKGIMVVVSNGYNGQWQIDKNNPVRGFCLNYEKLPIIVIKKQVSKGAQAFTLMHELAHLLLHKESAIDDDKDFYSYKGKEKEANEFASYVLMPNDFLNKINLIELGNLDIQEYDNYLKAFKQDWCVSGDAILYRLFLDKEITKAYYQKYRNFKEQQRKKLLEEEKTNKELGLKTKIIPRKYRHKETINMFGRAYVATVLDARHNKHITLSKASSYLDNLKIHTLHKLERDFV
jgi:Zn-dependent peptidase ImmA (M78 family)